jgi:tRNA pseudouridine55 synthase
MRSIAHELGQRLGCGAHLESLRRTSVAEFDIAQAHTLEEIEAAVKDCHSERTHAQASASRKPALSLPKGIPISESSLEDAKENSPNNRELLSLFIHPRQLLPQLPSVTADEPTAARIRNGRTVNLPELSRAREVKVFASQTELIAIATRVAGTLFHPKIVFSGATENLVKPPSR